MRTQLIADFPYAYNTGYFSDDSKKNPWEAYKTPPTTTPITDDQKQYYVYLYGQQDRQLNDLLQDIGREKISTATGHRPERFADNETRKYYPEFVQYLPQFTKDMEMEYDLRKQGWWITRNMWRGIRFWFDALLVRGYRIFITGGCIGFDQEYELFIKQVQSLETYTATYKDERVTIDPSILIHIMAIPMVGQSNSRWSSTQKENYNFIQSYKTFLYYCEMHTWNVVGSQAYLDRDHWMVDHSSVVHACYLERMKDKVRRSGTGATIRYGLKQGLTIVGYDPFTQHEYVLKP